jgi:hypothetical protein
MILKHFNVKSVSLIQQLRGQNFAIMIFYDFFHKVPLAPSMCLFKWIKVDKLDYLKIGSRNFKNSFYFGIVIS